MAKTLEELKDKLSEAFDFAVEKAKKYADQGYQKEAAQMFESAARLADSFVGVEAEQREAQNSRVSRLDKK